MVVHSITQQYAAVRSGTQRYAAVRSGTQRYAAVRSGTQRYAAVRSGLNCTQRYAMGTQCYASLRIFYALLHIFYATMHRQASFTHRYACFMLCYASFTLCYASPRIATHRHASLRIFATQNKWIKKILWITKTIVVIIDWLLVKVPRLWNQKQCLYVNIFSGLLVRVIEKNRETTLTNKQVTTINCNNKQRDNSDIHQPITTNCKSTESA